MGDVPLWPSRGLMEGGETLPLQNEVGNTRWPLLAVADVGFRPIHTFGPKEIVLKETCEIVDRGRRRLPEGIYRRNWTSDGRI